MFTCTVNFFIPNKFFSNVVFETPSKLQLETLLVCPDGLAEVVGPPVLRLARPQPLQGGGQLLRAAPRGGEAAHQLEEQGEEESRRGGGEQGEEESRCRHGWWLRDWAG